MWKLILYQSQQSDLSGLPISICIYVLTQIWFYSQVIYSLNTKNEEQEATLQSLRRVATETQGNLQPTTSQDVEEEESILRTRLLELQATVEEVKTVTGAQICIKKKRITASCGCVSISGGGT